MSEPPANTPVTIEAFNELKTLVTALSSQLSAQQQAQPQVQQESRPNHCPRHSSLSSSPCALVRTSHGQPCGRYVYYFPLYTLSRSQGGHNHIYHSTQSSLLQLIQTRPTLLQQGRTEDSGAQWYYSRTLQWQFLLEGVQNTQLHCGATDHPFLHSHGALPADGKISPAWVQFFCYTAHLTNITSEYEWHVVVAYHMAFFTRWWHEMINGDYRGWGCIDLELRGEHLFSNRKIKASSPHLKESHAHGSVNHPMSQLQY